MGVEAMALSQRMACATGAPGRGKRISIEAKSQQARQRDRLPTCKHALRLVNEKLTCIARGARHTRPSSPRQPNLLRQPSWHH